MTTIFVSFLVYMPDNLRIYGSIESYLNHIRLIIWLKIEEGAKLQSFDWEISVCCRTHLIVILFDIENALFIGSIMCYFLTSFSTHASSFIFNDRFCVQIYRQTMHVMEIYCLSPVRIIRRYSYIARTMDNTSKNALNHVVLLIQVIFVVYCELWLLCLLKTIKM